MTDPGLPEIKLYTGTRDIRYGKEVAIRDTTSLVGDVEEILAIQADLLGIGEMIQLSKRWGTNRIEEVSMN